MEKLFLNEKFLDIEYNLKKITENIENAAIKSNRNPNDIQFMAVTKTVDSIYINKAIDFGIKLIGENKVQELLLKKPDLNIENVDCHLIGHLQTNKVSKVIGEVSCIQSVDSLKLAKEISKCSQKANIITDILLEINIGEEESKTGFNKDVLLENLYEISDLEGVKVKGLMTIPPISSNNSKVRQNFLNMRNMFVDIGAKKIHNISMDILSMGMSGDYHEAILEGSNLVRIGSAIFGARIY